jgi:hypothetical protein
VNSFHLGTYLAVPTTRHLPSSIRVVVPPFSFIVCHLRCVDGHGVRFHGHQWSSHHYCKNIKQNNQLRNLQSLKRHRLGPHCMRNHEELSMVPSYFLNKSSKYFETQLTGQDFHRFLASKTLRRFSVRTGSNWVHINPRGAEPGTEPTEEEENQNRTEPEPQVQFGGSRFEPRFWTELRHNPLGVKRPCSAINSLTLLSLTSLKPLLSRLQEASKHMIDQA